ncbi:MAG: hypothetical protein QXY24_03965 [Candidatus Aenigmatarchaeota archaeon]
MDELPKADLYIVEKAEEIVEDLKNKGFTDIEILPSQKDTTPEAVVIRFPYHLNHSHEDHLRFFINYSATNSIKTHGEKGYRSVEVWHEENGSGSNYYLCDVRYHPDRSVRDVLMRIYTRKEETIVKIPIRQAGHPLVDYVLDFIKNYPENKNRYSEERKRAFTEIYEQV